ncbi:hypothetical protein GLIP_1392 [Aliiglaciecola lipolytica E3]|uniref:Uncharacterized protein n=1 Tax=Aliiglaciecola lipolytica E3 TaxID=1127673 RepID=K6YBK9_9ALTE|nr:hypothetical protein GLIP_1392 [Aliiglaciecola lipolytica E3]
MGPWLPTLLHSIFQDEANAYSWRLQRLFCAGDGNCLQPYYDPHKGLA